MRQFILVTCLAIASVSARPEQGYSYNTPVGGGLPANLLPPTSFHSQPFAPAAHSHHSGHSQAFHAPSQSYSQPSQSYGTPSIQSYAAPAPSALYSAPAQSSHSSFSGSSFGSGGPSIGAEQTTIQKHIYVHVPPPDVEEQQQYNQGSQGITHQKHYKIIFIKAPSSSSNQNQLIQQQQQVSEEKTIVYVLVKKPESQQELRQAQAAQAQTVQNKPEVYFIKYRAEQGASQSLGSSGGNGDPFGSGGSEFSGGSSHSDNSGFQGGSGHQGGNTYLPPVENPPQAEIIQPRTPAPEYGPPKHI